MSTPDFDPEEKGQRAVDLMFKKLTPLARWLAMLFISAAVILTFSILTAV